MRIELYKETDKALWDDFVRQSKNGTFLFYRDFIEYHGARFNDYSLMFFDKKELVALMPGHISDKTYYSHQGLTYGGLVMGKSATMVKVLEIFDHLCVTFRQQGLESIIYKAVPHIYHKSPAEEDLYALFRCRATLVERSISSAFLLSDEVSYSELRRRGVNKALKNGLLFEKSAEIALFWEILDENLTAKYNVHPVHNLEEITYLMQTFPQNIHLFTVKSADGALLAGCMIFETDTVAHVQYVASNEKGRENGAVDLLISRILEFYKGKKVKYFDYGISTENNGSSLNESLIQQKEGFGLRGIIYDKYVINLKL
ncbi:GNAT family N-acetyltransferase [Dysgonomonas sp. 25]|uniref:GNAT family N-acetyltransferase n=1 Tax=Dysgonomonas sp. 25 TaxID=2302933 RepID=UPI0013D53D54|nr:GNAT family N-acetyltransferase [Dysgonomonas sp. 25]NDV68647.1 GNAT family N-acetyltransferase [Dysgonomonas sp. 25]